jgi:dienelactone hydrolase
MKKYLFLFLLSFKFITAQQPDYKAIAEDIFKNIRERDFAKATALFDSGFAARFDSTKVRQAWDKLLTLSGPFVKVLETKLDHQPNFDVVLQHSQFEKKKIDFKVVFGTNEKVKGISFLPGEPREVYKLPDYYYKDSIIEIRKTMKNGPVNLSGVLTVPNKKGKFPLVILIHGTGPNDKDESVGATKIFKDLAIGLANNGVGVYRYDKRTRAQRVSSPRNRVLTVNEESIEDAVAAFNMMKSDSLVDSTAIYFAGHSFGGMILPRIADQAKGVAGLIYLAANARRLEDVMKDQTFYMLGLDTSGKDHSHLRDSISRECERVKALKPGSKDTTYILFQPVTYWLDLNAYNPVHAALKLNVPMFFIHGGRDYQTTSDDFNMWKNGLSGANAQFKNYPDLNHFFVAGKGKSSPMEYNKSANVHYPLIKDIAQWILSTKK